MRILQLLLFLGLLFTGNAQIQNAEKGIIAYTDSAIKILENGTVLFGKENIEKWYQSNPMGIATFETVFSIAANDQFQYEIGTFSTEKGQHKHLVITDRTNNNARVFEVIAQVGDTDAAMEKIISSRRDKWIALCNKNNAQDLVRQLYAAAPIYYNHRPPVTDPDTLIQVYGYMNDPGYSLYLQPLHLERVNDNRVFEIGQCSGSYNGKYILIWEKTSTGEWVIKIDSNI
ncbi:MAG: hypothetical protein AAF717_01245 [Bacteroidota bacterium]